MTILFLILYNMSIRVFSHKFFSSVTSIPPLIGNETIYSEELAKPLINTFSGDSMTPFYFIVNYYYLQPKYTTSFNEFGLCIIVSDEMFDLYFTHGLFDLLDFTITYQIPNIDIISLKRITGDFPEDSSIDELLTSYLESCSIINKTQQFTIHFETNKLPLQNFITFEVTDFTVNLHEEIENTFQEKLNTNLHPLGISANVIPANHLVGKVSNHEIKVDFIITKDTLPPPQKAVNKSINKNNLDNLQPGMQMTDKVCTPLTKDELREIRLRKFSLS